jgi:phosphinothricin acetyltransferase
MLNDLARHALLLHGSVGFLDDGPVLMARSNRTLQWDHKDGWLLSRGQRKFVGAPTGSEVRAATREDAAAIARIYNQGIEDRIATFQAELRSVADIERLLADRHGHYPTIVVERGGEVVAWASAGSYRSAAWYQAIAEHSVYVDRAHRGSGVGRVALEALCKEAERLGVFKLVSRIFVENVASRALHQKVGFREVGILSSCRQYPMGSRHWCSRSSRWMDSRLANPRCPRHDLSPWPDWMNTSSSTRTPSARSSRCGSQRILEPP